MFHGFTKYANQDISVTLSGVTRRPTGRFDVIHGTANNGTTVLFGLTEHEADMAIEFLTSVESVNGELWQQIQNRLHWADRATNKGLDALIRPSMVHGGITQPEGHDPIGLVIKDGQIAIA
jgi:hypothetical protein